MNVPRSVAESGEASSAFMKPGAVSAIAAVATTVIMRVTVIIVVAAHVRASAAVVERA